MFSLFQSILIPRWPQDGLKMVARGPKMDQGGPKMAQDGPKMAHIHEIGDSYTLLPPQVPETSFFTTQIEGAIGRGRARRSATNRGEARRIATNRWGRPSKHYQHPPDRQRAF